MKTFRNFVKDEYSLEMPHDSIPGTWFSENGFPDDCRLHLLRHDDVGTVSTD